MNCAPLLRWLVFPGILGFLLGGAWGFWNARQTSPQTGPAGSPAKPAVAVAGKPGVDADADLLNDPLKGLPAEALPHAGTLNLLTRIAKAKAEDLPGLLLEMVAREDYQSQKILLERWVELDPEGGFAHVRGLTSPPFTAHQRSSMIWELLGRWSLRDPDTALARMQTLPEQRDRAVAVSRITQALAAERPADYFRLLTELSKQSAPETRWFLKQAAAAYASADPAAALQALDNAAPDVRNQMLAGIAGGWAKRNPDASMAWARGLPDEKERSLALHSIAYHLILQDSALAARIYQEGGNEAAEGSSGPGTDADSSIQQLAEKLAARSSLEAINWLKQHFPEKQQGLGAMLASKNLPHDAGEAVEQIIQVAEFIFEHGTPSFWMTQGQWMPDNIPAGLEKASAIEDPSLRDSMRALLMGIQAKAEPETAIAAARGQIENESSRAYVMHQALQTWAARDLTAASAWLAAQPPGAERDGAIDGFNEVAKVAEPDSALRWAAAMSEPVRRQAQIAQTLGSWSNIDRTAAEAALNTLNIPEEEKAALSKRVFTQQP